MLLTTFAALWQHLTHRSIPPTMKLDDGWPESAEEHVTLVLLEGVQKRCVVSWRCIEDDSDDEQKGDIRDDMLDSKQMKNNKKVQETDSDRQKQTWTGIDSQRYIETHRDTQKQTHMHTHTTQGDITQTHTHTTTHTHRHTHRHADTNHTQRHQTHRHQTHKETHTHKHTDIDQTHRQDTPTHKQDTHTHMRPGSRCRGDLSKARLAKVGTNKLKVKGDGTIYSCFNKKGPFPSS